jgi:hypothetical protein
MENDIIIVRVLIMHVQIPDRASYVNFDMACPDMIIYTDPGLQKVRSLILVGKAGMQDFNPLALGCREC